MAASGDTVKGPPTEAGGPSTSTLGLPAPRGANATAAAFSAAAAAPVSLATATTAIDTGFPQHRMRGRGTDGLNLTSPAAAHEDDESEGETDAGAPGEGGGRAKPSRKINLVQSFKSLKSVFSMRSSRTQHDAKSSGITLRPTAVEQRLRLSQSMLPVQKEYKEPLRTQLVKWINYRIRMESFFALYSLWTLQRALVLCGIGMVVFLCLGVTLIVMNDKHVECKLNYEEYSLGGGGTRYECLPITTDACGPGQGITTLEGEEIYVYYELEKFNQNGGQIVWNRNDKQLAGHIFTDPADVKDCEPFATRVVDNVTKVLHPCGALAWHVFNDNFLFFDAPPDGPGGQGTVKPLPLMQTREDILMPRRWERLYRNPSAQERQAVRDKVYFWMSVDDNDDGRDGRGKPEEGLAWAIHELLNFDQAGMMVENSHFIQWMEVAALPTFRKLYGKLKGPLQLPLYAYISINYDVKPWGGKKAVVLVVPSVFHGRTLYIGIAYLVLGCILLLFFLYLLWRLHLARDESTFGDIRWRTMLTRHKRKNK